MQSKFSLLAAIVILLTGGGCAQQPSPVLPAPQEITASSSGVTLHVRVAGNMGSNNLMIAIHGGPGMTSDYMLNLERLAGPDMAVATYDQRGVGRSSSPPEDPENYTLDKYAEDVEAVRLAVGINEVHLFGHSWGGIVAQHYASRYPDHVRSLVLMGSGPPNREQTLACQDAIIERIIELMKQGVIPENPKPGSPEAERNILPAYFSDPNFWFSPDDLGGAPLIDERTAIVSKLTWEANDSFDLAAELANLQINVLNLWGDDDPARAAASPAILAALPDSGVETVVLDTCGHFWHECPEQFFSILRSFLERNKITP